jgi:hypothetical protein
MTSLPATNSRRHVTSAVVALNDDIALSNHLTLTLGLRADFSRGSADGAARGISWQSVAPVALVRWAPRAFVMTAGFRRYMRQLSPDLLAFGDPGSPVVDVHRWDDLDADGAFDTGERGVLVARSGRAPDVASIDPGLHPSYTNEFSGRAERQILGRHYLRLTATVRREYDLIRSVNTGAPLSAYRAISVPNQIDDLKRARDGLLTVYDRLPETFGQDHYELRNAPGKGANYRGLELAWEFRGRTWYALAGASAYESSGIGGNRGFRVTENDPGVIGELLENPNAASFTGSRGFADRAYVLKWSTVYRGAGGLVAGVTARYQDGQAFTRSVLVPTLAQGAEMVAADYSDATRFTFTVTVDARVSKTFTLRGQRQLTALMDVFSLSNLDEEVEENLVSGPGFRASTAMQPPITARLGLRLDF